MSQVIIEEPDHQLPIRRADPPFQVYRRQIPLAANGQEARYIEEMFTFTGADRPDFVGSVRCTVPPGEAMFTGAGPESGGFSGMGLR